MKGILDKMARPKQFRPTTVDEYLALHLAKRLCDEFAIHRYVQYVANHDFAHLLRLLQRAKIAPDPARAFHSSLILKDQ